MVGRHFLQIPGPTNVPDAVLRAMSAPTIDHRGAAFARMARGLLQSLKPVFGTAGPVVIYPSSGTGGWEAALVNTLSPGDRVLCFDNGHFSRLWRNVAVNLGLDAELVATDWRGGVDAGLVSSRLAADRSRSIRAVLIVHNETSTGTLTDVSAVRNALDAADHPALLIVDAVSSIGAVRYLHDEWRVDVSIAASQKGLMLPPGLAFHAISAKALDASANARLPRSYWAWEPILRANDLGSWPYTPATNLLFGLKAALTMLEAEGLESVAKRHARHGAATRAAVREWGLDVYCRAGREYSPVLTAVEVPSTRDADDIRAVILNHFNMSLGAGLGALTGRVFRIGHLGHFNDVSLAGALAGVQMGLGLSGLRVSSSGVSAALERLMLDR